MKSRAFSFERDYKTIYEWWKGWKMTPVPPKYLPPTGIIIENNGKDLASCFIYRTDTVWCVINWFLTNPKAKKKNRKGCVDFLIKEALKKAKEMGFEMCDIITEGNSLVKKLESNGFIKNILATQLVRFL